MGTESIEEQLATLQPRISAVTTAIENVAVSMRCLEYTLRKDPKATALYTEEGLRRIPYLREFFYTATEQFAKLYGYPISDTQRKIRSESSVPQTRPLTKLPAVPSLAHNAREAYSLLETADDCGYTVFLDLHNTDRILGQVFLVHAPDPRTVSLLVEDEIDEYVANYRDLLLRRWDSELKELRRIRS